jgi:hypothetical protein
MKIMLISRYSNVATLLADIPLSVVTDADWPTEEAFAPHTMQHITIQLRYVSTWTQTAAQDMQRLMYAPILQVVEIGCGHSMNGFS